MAEPEPIEPLLSVVIANLRHFSLDNKGGFFSLLDSEEFTFLTPLGNFDPPLLC
jgi:hypothetical protein